MNLHSLSLSEKDLLPKDSLVWMNLIQLFIANLDRKETTRRTYEKALKQWVYFLETAKFNPDINPVLEYKNYLINKKLSAYSISVYLSALKVFFGFLVERNIIHSNPAKSIRCPKKPSGRRDALTKDEALKLLSLSCDDTLESLRNRGMLWLLLFSGIRSCSVTKANVGDIIIKDGQYLLYYQGKGRDSRDEFVVLSSEVYDVINSYLAKRGNISPESPLFASLSDRNSGSRLTAQSIRMVINEFFARAGISRAEISCHSLRHSAISFALRGGAKIEEVREIAGHSDINMTASYIHCHDRLKNPAELSIRAYLNA